MTARLFSPKQQLKPQDFQPFKRHRKQSVSFKPQQMVRTCTEHPKASPSGTVHDAPKAAINGGRHLEDAVSGSRSEASGALHREPSLDRSANLSLSNIRHTLIRQEDTIIYSILERAQFARNPAVYQSGAIPIPSYSLDGQQASLLEYLLRESEQLFGRIRRYTSPDEHAFFPQALPPLVLPPLTYPKVLAACADSININDRILSVYVDDIVPSITDPGDDNNYGSAALCDVLCLSALSKRIHYGKFVAEAKFAADPAAYTDLIRQKDVEGLMAMLTDASVEAKVLQRVRKKAEMYGQDLDDVCTTQSDGGCEPEERLSQYKVDPQLVANLYERWVVPLTKEVQIAYLLNRLL